MASTHLQKSADQNADPNQLRALSVLYRIKLRDCCEIPNVLANGKSTIPTFGWKVALAGKSGVVVAVQGFEDPLAKPDGMACMTPSRMRVSETMFVLPQKDNSNTPLRPD